MLPAIGGVLGACANFGRRYSILRWHRRRESEKEIQMIKLDKRIRLTAKEMKRFRRSTNVTNSPETLEQYNRAYENISRAHEDAAQMFSADAATCADEQLREDLVSAAAMNHLFAVVFQRYVIDDAED
jgi:hypothetical protein